MVRTLVILGLAAAAGVAGTALIAAQFRDFASGATAASAEALDVSSSIDLGAFPYGATAPFEITVRNTSAAADLRIEKITTNCGCTTTTPAPIDIPRGGSATVVGHFVVSKDLALGASSSIVNLFQANSEAPRRVTLQANLITPFPPDLVRSPDGAATLQINSLYRGIIESVICYPGQSDAAVPSVLEPDDGRLTITGIPASAEVLQVVLKITPGDEQEPYQIVQEIDLADTNNLPGDSESQGSK